MTHIITSKVQFSLYFVVLSWPLYNTRFDMVLTGEGNFYLIVCRIYCNSSWPIVSGLGTCQRDETIGGGCQDSCRDDTTA